MDEGLFPSNREQDLRKRAEHKLKHLALDSLAEKSPEEVRQMIHELQAYQVEMEMQQEELYATNHALKESEARYRQLYQYAPNGYFTVNAQGGIEEANFAAARLLGLERRLVMGTLLRKFILARSRACFDDFFLNLQYHHGTHRCEVSLMCLSGESSTVTLEGTRLEETSSQMHFLITAIDITDRKKAELTLQAQTELLQKVMDAVMTGVAVFDSVHNAQGEIVDFEYRLTNAVLEKIAGRKLAGLRLLENFPGFKTAGIFDRLKSVIETGQSVAFEQYYQEEGFANWFHITAVSLGDGIISIVDDITERKRLEAENLRMRLDQQKVLLHGILEAQEEERRRISESLHNGVGQILYAVKLHLDQIKVHKTPISVEQVQQAKQKTEQLLTEAIRETRRVSHELIPILLQEYGLAVAISDFCKRFSHTGLQLSCNGLEERLENHLEMAIYRISQELVNNIVKHAEATRARIEVFREKKLIIIEAEDNGKGMKPRRSGKGIGLKSIQDRVKLLEGSVEIDSTPGKGTLITVSIPISKAQGLLGGASRE